ncbi:MAG: DUF3465 domain-containing protein, partial [Deltaproteobacteria bacterium]
MSPHRRAARLVALAAALLALARPATGWGSAGDAGGPPPDAGAAAQAGDAALARAFDDRVSGLEVEGAGTVERLLADDEQGSRHQRFILRLASGQTLLVAHNIDVAPRIAGLRVGDVVAFRGVYEWSRQGGTVHWTHHDPSGDHEPGWLRHAGR